MTKATFAIGGDIDVRRLGFGAMRITGPDIWGPPRDRAAARALLRRAVVISSPDSGVNAVAAAAFRGVLLCGVDSLSEAMSPP